MEEYDNNPRLSFTPRRHRWLVALFIIGILVAIALALTDRAEAATVAGNQGGCGYRNRNMRYGVTCNVDDAGPGFVSGACKDGYWFSRVTTYRTFTIGQIVTVNGCEGIGQELYAPISIRKAR